MSLLGWVAESLDRHSPLRGAQVMSLAHFAERISRRGRGEPPGGKRLRRACDLSGLCSARSGMKGNRRSQSLRQGLLLSGCATRDRAPFSCRVCGKRPCALALPTLSACALQRENRLRPGGFPHSRAARLQARARTAGAQGGKAARGRGLPCCGQVLKTKESIGIGACEPPQVSRRQRLGHQLFVGR